MRNLTPYEKEKWFDDLGRFEAPEYVSYGDEIGETYDKVEACTRIGDYVGDEFELAAQIVLLDMYYDQLPLYYVDEHIEPEEAGLPSRELLEEQARIMGFDISEIPSYGLVTTFLFPMQLWDWCMEWRENNLQYSFKKQRIKNLEHELAVLRGEEDGS